MKDLLFFHKCRAGLLDIHPPDYVQSRPAPRYNIRSHDVNNFTELKCRTEYFKNSYFPRVVTKWNSLDSDLKTIDSFIVFLSLDFIRNFIVKLMIMNFHTSSLYCFFGFLMCI